MDILFSSHWYWLIGAMILMGMELLLPGVFLLWVGLGALANGICLALFPSIGLVGQIAMLVVFMFASIFLGIYVQKRRTVAPDKEINASLDRYIGKHARSVGTFEHGFGRIEIEDSSYQALSSVAVAGGQMVIITGIRDQIFEVVPMNSQSQAKEH